MRKATINSNSAPLMMRAATFISPPAIIAERKTKIGNDEIDMGILEIDAYFGALSII